VGFSCLLRNAGAVGARAKRVRQWRPRCARGNYITRGAHTIFHHECTVSNILYNYKVAQAKRVRHTGWYVGRRKGGGGKAPPTKKKLKKYFVNKYLTIQNFLLLIIFNYNCKIITI